MIGKWGCCRRCGMKGRDIGSDGVQRCTYCGIAHPDIDTVAYGQRIMDLVDQYYEKPNQQTRGAIRAALMDDWSAVSRPPEYNCAFPGCHCGAGYCQARGDQS